MENRLKLWFAGINFKMCHVCNELGEELGLE